MRQLWIKYSRRAAAKLTKKYGTDKPDLRFPDPEVWKDVLVMADSRLSRYPILLTYAVS